MRVEGQIEQERGAGEDQGVRDLRREHALDGAAHDHRVAEIEANDAGEPLHVALRRRGIEVEPGAQERLLLLGGHAPEVARGRITRERLDHHEYEERETRKSEITDSAARRPIIRSASTRRPF